MPTGYRVCGGREIDVCTLAQQAFGNRLRLSELQLREL